MAAACYTASTMSDEPDFEDEPPVWWPKLDEMPTDMRTTAAPIGSAEEPWRLTMTFKSRAAADNYLAFVEFISDPKNRAQIEADVLARPKWAARMAEMLKRDAKDDP